MSHKKGLDFDLIQKICGQEISFRLQGAMQNLNTTNTKIVNTGMVSSGKSSLYNLLTDHAEDERFPTGAARTTVRADACNYKNMIYIDTPGIDVRDADDEIAYQTVMESDIVLMIHNIKTGPLTRSEFDWLNRIAAGMHSFEMCKRRMIFICTWKDTRERDPDYNRILEEVKQMVFEAVGTDIPFFDVSTRKYLDGVRKGKTMLCEKSGIPALKDFIETYAAQYAETKEQFAREAFAQIAEEVRSYLDGSHREFMKEIEQHQSAIKKRYDSQRRSWKDVYDFFKQQRTKRDDLMAEWTQLKREYDRL